MNKEVKRIGHKNLGCTRIISYNLHGEAYGWGPDCFQPADPIDELESFDADVYVLPETWIPTGKDYRLPPKVLQWAELEDKHLFHARSVGVVRQYGETLHKGELHTVIVSSNPIVRTEEYLLPKHRNDPSQERRVPAVLIETDEGKFFWMVGVHLSSRVPFAPINNIKYLRKFVKHLRKSGHPVIIAGDFNLWGWWVKPFLRKGYRRAVRKATWPSDLPHSQIDHIMVPKGVKVASGGVCAPGFSDHRAIFAEIII